MDSTKRGNDLSGKEWLQNSFSIWRDLSKTKEEKNYGHPASYPVALCEKLIKTFARNNCNVIDPFNGIGSTTAACHNLNCPATGIDLSPEYCHTAQHRTEGDPNIRIINGDSLDVLKSLDNASFDLCITSPPYWDILNMKRSADQKASVNYSADENDLGNIADYNTFLKKTTALFLELKRTLKPGAYCVINVMDIRKKNCFYPLHSDLSTAMQKIGYIYDDLIIWDRQNDYNNMRPLGYPYRFRINKVHEYLLIFINPSKTMKEQELYEIIGYLANPEREINIEAEMPQRAQQGFIERYAAWTKNYPLPDDTTVRPYYVWNADKNKYGLELRAYFTSNDRMPQALEAMLEPSKYQTRPGYEKWVRRISKQKHIIPLLEHGFVLGPRQDVGRIESFIPPHYLDDFYRGLHI